MLVWTVELSCWLMLAGPCVLCCWLPWPRYLITQSGGRKLTYIVMVATCNLHVEWYGHCTVQQTYKNVLNNIVKVTNGSWVSLAVPYIELWRILTCMMVGILTVPFGWISAWMEHNCLLQLFCLLPINRDFYVYWSNVSLLFNFRTVFQERIVHEHQALPVERIIIIKKFLPRLKLEY